MTLKLNPVDNSLKESFKQLEIIQFQKVSSRIILFFLYDILFCFGQWFSDSLQNKTNNFFPRDFLKDLNTLI